MKEVTVLIPDDVDAERIYYLPNNRTEYVRAFIVPDRSAHFSTKAISFSDSGMEELSKRIKEFSAEAVLPLAPTEYPSRKEFEALRSRVEKLEQESKRQCARVIKMEEGISDDLK